jgi:hypothetical protein
MKITTAFLTHTDLLKQADLLQDVSREINPATIDLVQIAIVEDIQLFEMLHNQETRDQFLQQLLISETELRAGTIEAAQILVNLVLGEPL